MRILVCGDRHWASREIIENKLRSLSAGISEEITIVHGAARGADTLAGDVAEGLGYSVERHPAQWELYGRGAGPKRNIEMLRSDINKVIAFHGDISKSKGTKHCVESARSMGIPVEIISGKE